MGGQTIRMELAYDGGRFAGFARQPGLRTVEGVVRARLAGLVPGIRRLAVGGRTDRGVHAVAQVVSFRTRATFDLSRLASTVAPPDDPDLAVLDVRRVWSRFDAQFSAQGRRYAYFWSVPADFELLDRLRQLVQPLVGRHDFNAFARDTPRDQKTTRRIIEIEVRMAALDRRPSLRFDLVAEGFLRRQVRILVATALREARAGAPADRLLELARAGDRRKTAAPAPPDGLYLTKIVY